MLSIAQIWLCHASPFRTIHGLLVIISLEQVANGKLFVNIWRCSESYDQLTYKYAPGDAWTRAYYYDAQLNPFYTTWSNVDLCAWEYGSDPASVITLSNANGYVTVKFTSDAQCSCYDYCSSMCGRATATISWYTQCNPGYADVNK